MSATISNDSTPATLANWRTAPHNRWGFRNVRNIIPSAVIRAGKNTWELPRGGASALHGFVFDDRHDNTYRLDDILHSTCTDALVVLHDGLIIEERYLNGMTPPEQHILMSVSKSVTALLVGIFVGKGLIDTNGLVVDYLPELAGTAYEGATVRHLLDMQVGVNFDEDYHATDGLMIDYRRATNWNPLADGEAPSDLRTFLQTLKPKGQHGAPFRYRSPNSDLLGWLVERVGGNDFASLLSEHLWQPMGAEYDAYLTVDRLGAPRAAGGICMTARDMARVGLLMSNHGLNGEGESVVPAEWVADTMTGGDSDAWDKGNFASYFPGGCYRNKWYQYGNELGAVTGLGVHGQFMYVAPATGTVIARFASHPEPLDDASEMLWIDAMDAVARSL
jgi:CubicO group peptidase (beta-lactamase class C family)